MARRISPNKAKPQGSPLPREVQKLAYSRDEAAEALGVHPATIDNLRRRGLLKASYATRRPLFPVREIERFLEETSKTIKAV